MQFRRAANFAFVIRVEGREEHRVAESRGGGGGGRLIPIDRPNERTFDQQTKTTTTIMATPPIHVKKWGIFEFTLLCLCFLSTKYAEAHILVYQKINNQLIEEFNDLPAQFGPSLPPNGLKVYSYTTQPIDACTPIRRPQRDDYPPNAKFVAIIQRGGVNCTFELKVRHAQTANWNAVIVYNNEGDDLEQMSAQNSSGIFIPSVFVGHTTGMSLKSFITPEVVLVINDELPFNINTQLILPFSILIGLCFLVMIFYMIYKCIREERRLRRYRLPKSMLKKLPILKYTKNSDLSYETCVICLDEFVEGDKLRVLPCRHPYHSHCIDPWLTENRRVCPICKRKVFTKGEARSNRNRQSSLDSVTDTDDDTTPLLSNSAPSAGENAASAGTAVAAAVVAAAAATTRHGTFRRMGNSGGNSNNATAVTVDATSDDENVLLSSHNSPRRVNPFDRAPNLPPHLAEQLSANRGRSIWSRFRGLFRGTEPISVAAPPFLEEVVDDLAGPILTQPPPASLPRAAPPHSSNNILNPNLSGSFKDDDDGEPPHQSIYEPIAVITPNTTAATAAAQPDTESVFIQTPSQGGIGVVALPNPNSNPTNTERLFLI